MEIQYILSFAAGILIAILITLPLLKSLRKLALYDDLTGLYNYRKLYLEIDRIRKRQTNQDLSLVLLDIDNFKSLNDKAGYHYGDMLLKKFSRSLKSTLSPNSKVFRYKMGDEFAVITENDTVSLESNINKLKKEVSSIEISRDKKEAISFTYSVEKIDPSFPEKSLITAEESLRIRKKFKHSAN